MDSGILKEFEAIKEKNPHLFLDYDGTLVPIISEPEKAYPDPELIEILDALHGKYITYIVTGRSIREMREFLGSGLNVIALHGAVISESEGEQFLVDNIEYYRKTCDSIYAMRDQFMEKYPGIHITDKSGGIVFTLWSLTPEMRSSLEMELQRLAEEVKMSLYHGKMILELRIPGINKGYAIHKIRGGKPAVIAGDDITDEDSFSLNMDAITIKVGDGETKARFRVASVSDFRGFLRRL